MSCDTEHVPHFEYHPCRNPSCNLRFPVFGPDLSPGSREQNCPRCRGPVAITCHAPRHSAVGPDQPSPVSLQPSLRICGVLDNLRSAFNVGSIFRAADGAGLAALHICGYTATPAHDKVAKTALGAQDHLPWTYHANALNLIAHLRAEGWRIIALETTPTAHPLFSAGQFIAPATRVALVVGNEVVGIDPTILAGADLVLSIPMQGIKESLNVAVAFGIAAYWLTGLHHSRACS